jgi:hypothetical protein
LLNPLSRAASSHSATPATPPGPDPLVGVIVGSGVHVRVSVIVAVGPGVQV